jgi:uncharacterized protein YjiS (DUF1127 family)
MSAIDQGKVEKPIVHVSQDFGDALLALPAFVGGGCHKVFCWLQNEWRLNAAVRELRRLDDHYLEDIGIKRSSLDLRDGELRRRLRRAK